MTNKDEDVSEGSDLGFIVLCENYVQELRYGRIEDEIHGYLKDREKLANGRWDDVVICYGRFPMNGSEISRVFKLNYGFEEGGRFIYVILISMICIYTQESIEAINVKS